MSEESLDLKWWQLRFKFKQPPPEHGVAYPYFDLIISHMVLKPLIDNIGDELSSWHFNRRWKSDETGHVFSFFIKCDNTLKDEILIDIKSNSSFKILKDIELIEDMGCEEKIPNKDGIYVWDEWPKSLNANFPLFVHSLSLMWLGLIDEIKDFIPAKNKEPQTFEEMQIFYQQIEANINNEWLYRGSNFALNHVSGMFGYSPTLVSPEKIRGYLLSL